jgi:predicted alpha/beta-hydrolase family hydrolase
VKTVERKTAHGLARVHIHPSEKRRAGIVLGHGAGGGVAAPDLVEATRAALAEHVAVALVEQPYRVAGRRSPAPARQLDAVWLEVVSWLRTADFDGLPLVAGGRSSGARVACRTAASTGASAVLCLAFPLQPPGRAPASRLPELDAVAVPTLVVQGIRDPFGMPPAAALRTIAQVDGDHSLRSDLPGVAAAVRDWLGRVPFIP